MSPYSCIVLRSFDNLADAQQYNIAEVSKSTLIEGIRMIQGCCLGRHLIRFRIMHRDIQTHFIIAQIRWSCTSASFLSSVLGLFYAFTMKLVVSGCQGRMQQLQSQLRQVSSQPFEAQLAEERNCTGFCWGDKCHMAVNVCPGYNGFEWLWYVW